MKGNKIYIEKKEDMCDITRKKIKINIKKFLQ